MTPDTYATQVKMVREIHDMWVDAIQQKDEISERIAVCGMVVTAVLTLTDIAKSLELIAGVHTETLRAQRGGV